MVEEEIVMGIKTSSVVIQTKSVHVITVCCGYAVRHREQATWFSPQNLETVTAKGCPVYDNNTLSNI